MGACATKPRNVDMEKKAGEAKRDPSEESYTRRPTLREIFQQYDEKKADKDDNSSVQENFHDAEELHDEKEEPNPKNETVQNLKPVSAEESKPESEKKDETGELEKFFSFVNSSEERKSVECESNANGSVVTVGTGEDEKEKKYSPVGEKLAA